MTLSGDLSSVILQLWGDDMTITLYHTISEQDALIKTLTSASSDVTATVRDAVDILSPILRIQQTVRLDSYNYLYILEFDRYYWIRDIVIDRTGLSELHCECDVLMSHASEILACNAVFDRTANADIANVETADGLQRLQADQDIDYYEFDNGLTYPERIIMICNV